MKQDQENPPGGASYYREEVRDDGSLQWKELHARARGSGVQVGPGPR